MNDAASLPLSELKPLLAHPGSTELLDLHRTRGESAGVAFCERFLAETPPGEMDPPPLITGEDLMALGLTPGPEFKRLLGAVRAAQLENRVQTPAAARALVEELQAR